MMDAYRDARFVRPRRELVKLLEAKGISDPRVLEAIGKVPRHLFVDPALQRYAYEDRPLPIGNDQTISQPYTVAFMTQLLEVRPGMKVLEVGTGSGYQTAVLLEMGAKVYSIERIRDLYAETKDRLEELGYYPIHLTYGDGYLGLPAFAPYDRIIVTAGAPEIPPALIEQLKPGGILVIPLGTGSQRMLRIRKQADGRLVTEDFGSFMFVPLRGGKI